MIYIPDEIRFILERLEKAGYCTYVVGGAVRDMLIGRRVHDYDVCTSAPPYEIQRVFADHKTAETGLKHGTVTVIRNGSPVEVTTFRRDGGYSDGRHPDSVSFTASIEEDLGRRDFTVNAIALGTDGKLTDPYGGQSDIEAKLIRCVREPERRFEEDRLRILRALRFSSELCFGIEENTAKAIRRSKELILTVSAERVYSELCRLLEGEGASAVLTGYPEVICLILGIENGDRYKKTAEKIGLLDSDHCQRLAALLFGQNAEKAAAAMRSLKAKNSDKARVVNAVRYGGADVTTAPELKKLIGKIGFDTAKDIFMIRSLFCEEAKKLYLMTADIYERKEPVFLKDLAVDGSDLTAVGVTPGRLTGEILAALLDAVIENKVKNEKSDLLAFASSFMKKKT